MNKPKPRAIDFFLHEELIFWSFRYFLGRQTIATLDFAERLARSWEHLSERNQALIKSELEVAFIEDDQARDSGEIFKPLGADCDRKGWELVRKAYKK